ncbi:MAG: adenine phosphoribosyltransferase [Candidatus Omnitrophota bacterium]
MAQPLSRYIRNIPDFPKKGILFRDVTTLIKNKTAFRRSVNEMAKICKGKKIDVVAAVEARGFIFGGALAYKLGVGFVPVRKKGKLPFKTHRVTYDLEYGTDTLEVHTDAIKKGMRVLIVDDLLATGGTVGAVVKMMHKLKAKIVGILFLIELVDLKGKEKLKNYTLKSLIKFKGE